MCGAQQGGCLPIVHSTLGTTLKQCGGHACKPSTQEMGTGESRLASVTWRVWSQPGLSETLSHKKEVP